MNGDRRLRRQLGGVIIDVRITVDMVVSALERNRRCQLGVVVALAVAAAWIVTKIPGSGSPVAVPMTMA